jgi:hypothetical protein
MEYEVASFESFMVFLSYKKGWDNLILAGLLYFNYYESGLNCGGLSKL